jgi:hypothetical protein
MFTITRRTALAAHAAARRIASKAIVCADFGAPEVMLMTTKEVATPSDGEVLVRIHAAGVNPRFLRACVRACARACVRVCVWAR